MKPFRPLLIISGPTASGKTSLSLDIAQKFPMQAEVVNFDSLLFYKELDIGVAKPSREELSLTTHHFVSFRKVSNPLNAYEFSRMAIPKINELIQKNTLPILTGGSGFYLQAILQGMYDSSPSQEVTRKKSDKLYQKEGITPFLKILKRSDPLSLERYHENDHYRLRRAVEFFWDNNSPLSQARSKKDNENLNKSDWPQEKFQWDILHIYLDLPKEEHLEIIKERTKKMIKAGLVKEVENLLTIYPHYQDLKPLQSIGYKETFNYLNGSFDSLDQCVERINISTRQLAKSQRTWFNKKEKETFHPIKDREKILKRVQDFLSKTRI